MNVLNLLPTDSLVGRRRCQDIPAADLRYRSSTFAIDFKNQGNAQEGNAHWFRDAAFGSPPFEKGEGEE